MGRTSEGWKLWGISIPPAHVVVKVRYRVWYCQPHPVVVVILVVICNEGGVVLCVVDLHDCVIVL